MGVDYHTEEGETSTKPSPLWKIIFTSSIAAGIQFGWALQLSLLTPYVQLLGVPHTWSSFIWLCGPISGIVVQPVVGYISDRLNGKYGRRKPFIASGTFLICISVVLIGFAADIGYRFGDSAEKATKPKAVVFFVLGFWFLDVANNMVQGSARAFLADLSKNDHRKMTIANAFFSFFMAVGNILGYAAGSAPRLYTYFPFTKTQACDTYCANLKSCFIIDIVFLLCLTVIALLTVAEPDIEDDSSESRGEPFFSQLKEAFKTLGKPMWLLFLVTALNWIGWFPFTMYNTDWVGREVFGGDTQGSPRQKSLYDMGVRTGSLGLMLNAIVLGVMSLLIDPLSKLLNGAKTLWGIVNITLAICLAITWPITKAAENARKHLPPGAKPPKDVRSAVLGLFAATGIPQAGTFSIPFALASMFSDDSGSGQGLSLGVMNLAICIPQMFVAVISGPWDNLFGGGNLPAFLLGAVSAVLSGIFAFIVLPRPSSNV